MVQEHLSGGRGGGGGEHLGEGGFRLFSAPPVRGAEPLVSLSFHSGRFCVLCARRVKVLPCQFGFAVAQRQKINTITGLKVSFRSLKPKL